MRGATLGTVLLVLSLGSVLMFGAATAGIFSLRFAVGLDQRDHARNLAEAAVAMAVAEIAAREGFGRAGESVQARVPADLPAGSSGRLTFSSAQAALWGLPASTHNLGGATAIPGSAGARVPRGAVRLVGLGRCGDASYLCECLFYRPPSPTGVVSSGPIDAENLILAGVTRPSEFAGTLGSIPAEQRLPAHLFSNRTQPEAVVLRPGCEISGNAGATGSLKVEPGAIVRGEVRNGAEAVTLPHLDLPAMLEQVREAAGEWAFGETTTVSALQYFGSDRVIPGDLALEGGAVCVDGDLTVTGRVTGRGALLASGDIKLGRGSSVYSTDLVALAAGGNVTLAGSGHSFFQGLLYSQGSLRVANVTVLGALVVNAPEGQGGVQLEDVTLVQTPVALTLRQGLPASGNGMHEQFHMVTNHAESESPERVVDSRTRGTWAYQGSRRVDGDGQELFDFSLAVNITVEVGEDPSPDDDEFVVNLNGATREQLQAALAGIPEFTEYLAESRVGEYIGALTQGDPHPLILSFDLNQVLSPLERSRILRWRRL